MLSETAVTPKWAIDFGFAFLTARRIPEGTVATSLPVPPAAIGPGTASPSLTDLEPSLIFASSSGLIEYDAHPVLAAAGLPVVLAGDWLEKTPLGRAEWVKFVGLFYNREAEAEAMARRQQM